MEKPESNQFGDIDFVITPYWDEMERIAEELKRVKVVVKDWAALWYVGP